MSVGLPSDGIWFRRLWDIPSLGALPPTDVNREKLPGHDLVPEVRRYRWEDQTETVVVSWGWVQAPPSSGDDHEDEQGETDRDAPCHEHMAPLFDDPDCSADRLLVGLWESMELPGKAEDYHWQLEQARERLLSKRLSCPSLVDAFETVLWLDFRLVLARPDIVLRRSPEDGREVLLRVDMIDGLIGLYETEGYLREAIEVAELAQRFPGQEAKLADLQARLEAVRHERVG